MKAIATFAALFCSVSLTFAQDGLIQHSTASPAGPLVSLATHMPLLPPLSTPSVMAPIAAVTPLDAGAPAATNSAADSEDLSVNNLWELLRKGGWAMIPLGVLSVIVGMLVIGFTLTIRRGTIATRQYIGTVEVLIRKKDYLGVLAVSNRHGEALARVVQRALDFATKNPGVPFESLKEVAEAEGSAQASAMQHRVATTDDWATCAELGAILGTTKQACSKLEQHGVRAIWRMQLDTEFTRARLKLVARKRGKVEALARWAWCHPPVILKATSKCSSSTSRAASSVDPAPSAAHSNSPLNTGHSASPRPNMKSARGTSDALNSLRRAR